MSPPSAGAGSARRPRADRSRRDRADEARTRCAGRRAACAGACRAGPRAACRSACCIEVRVGDDQVPVVGGLAHHREGAALAPAERLELGQAIRCDAQHVALLGLVAPELEGAHARLVVGHLAQLEARAAPLSFDQLGQRVREPAGADVVDRDDRALLALRPAAVDHLLAATLHLGVVALHRGEVEVLVARARGHRGGGTAAQVRSAWPGRRAR